MSISNASDRQAALDLLGEIDAKLDSLLRVFSEYDNGLRQTDNPLAAMLMSQLVADRHPLTFRQRVRKARKLFSTIEQDLRILDVIYDVLTLRGVDVE